MEALRTEKGPCSLIKAAPKSHKIQIVEIDIPSTTNLGDIVEDIGFCSPKTVVFCLHVPKSKP
jgi:hypothetical protein